MRSPGFQGDWTRQRDHRRTLQRRMFGIGGTQGGGRLCSLCGTEGRELLASLPLVVSARPPASRHRN